MSWKGQDQRGPIQQQAGGFNIVDDWSAVAQPEESCRIMTQQSDVDLVTDYFLTSQDEPEYLFAPCGSFQGGCLLMTPFTSAVEDEGYHDTQT